MTISNRTIQTSGAVDANCAEPTTTATAPQGAFSMDRCLYFGRVIDALARGREFRNHASRFLKIAAAGIAFTGLIALFNAWQFTSRQEASGIIGGIAYMFFLVIGIYMVVHAIIIRAGNIAALQDGEFTLIPLCAVLSLLAGEAFAAFTASVSLGGGLLIWFAPRGAIHLLKEISTFVPTGEGTDFLAGILFMIRGLVRAAAALTGGYLVSELLLVVGRQAGKKVLPDTD